MEILIQKTDQWVIFKGVECRLWRGINTEALAACIILIPAISYHKDDEEHFSEMKSFNVDEDALSDADMQKIIEEWPK